MINLLEQFNDFINKLIFPRRIKLTLFIKTKEINYHTYFYLYKNRFIGYNGIFKYLYIVVGVYKYVGYFYDKYSFDISFMSLQSIGTTHTIYYCIDRVFTFGHNILR